MTAAVPPPDAALVRVRDLAGRPRGAGFVADHHGTVVTSHEAVDGLPRLVLLTADERSVEVTADAVTPLPELDLALIRIQGLEVPPLPVTARDRVDAGTYVRLLAGCWREARVLASASVTYTATDRVHVVEDVLELAIGTAGRDALRLGGGAAGGPVLDARTGAVVAVVGTALRSGHSETGFAVPLRPATGPLADLLARNAATVPAYGADLGLAGVLELTATALGSDGPPGTLPGHPAGAPDPVERPAVREALAAFLADDTPVLALVGRPGSGRTTELAALAARRARGAEPAPTLWLRGADLDPGDTSLADAARRALARAARVVAASHGTTPADLGDLDPDRLARLATASGRPLLLVLDGPEEMPPDPAHRPTAWTRATARWLEGAGARLVLGCGPEYWEGVGTEFPQEMLYGDARRPAPHVSLPDLTPEEAARAHTVHGIPDGALSGADACHPLTLRLLSEVLSALPGDSGPPGPLDRDDVFAAHLDLLCLRVAVRLAAENGLRGTAVRRLAARVAGQVHEAARRSLGPGQGALDRETFEAVFPWGPAPARLGGGTGWASAVLTEGLLVPAGSGYRFAHQDLADWIQGMHLDLDGALHALVHRPRVQEDGGPGPDQVPVPHHRIGPVVEALLHLARQHGPGALAERLRDLVHAMDADPGGWWAPRLLARTLRRVPDATPYTDVLRLLADRTAAARGRSGGVGGGGSTGELVGLVDEAGLAEGAGLADGADAADAVELPGEAEAVDAGDSVIATGSTDATGSGDSMGSGDSIDLIGSTDVRPPSWPGEFGPAFWAGLPLPLETRLDLLRRLVLADPAPQDAGAPRYLDSVAALLATAPTAVAAQLTRWFDDERPLPATPHATVATAAQALLHTHRHRALDDLTEILVDCAHRRADELLAALAEEEPSALCRAVDRWAHDERPARRVAAVTYGLRAAPHAGTDADRDLLRYAALALLSRPADAALHGGALGLLVRDPRTRARHLPQAVEHFLTGDPQLPPSALLGALDTHPEPVLDTVRARLRHRDADPGRLLCDLIEATAATSAAPALVRRVVGVVRDALEQRPEAAGGIAAYVDRRLDRPEEVPDVRPVLRPLVTGLLDGGPERVRATLAAVLTAPGAPRSRPLRTELRAFLLTHESEPSVLSAALHAAAPQEGPHVRDLVRRIGLLLVRTPEGAARFDRGVVDLGRHVPGFAARMAAWLTEEPQEWAAVVGPGTRRMIENLAGVRVPA
ncbi:S1C family serine protease [Streptomyces longwoodensis]|uniref:S1C family serine protease n=1 Tax=Streptomyces longwoodensis TaxID=68231 RepID=UPI0033FD5E6D